MNFGTHIRLSQRDIQYTFPVKQGYDDPNRLEYSYRNEGFFMIYFGVIF